MSRSVTLMMALVVAATSNVCRQAAGDEARALEAATLADAERELYGKTDDSRAGYTSHFNLDNRTFHKPNDPTTNKYRCMVECVLDNGNPKWLRADAVKVGHLKEVAADEMHIRVVKCRFWWKLRPVLSPWYCSDWVEAGQGNYIVYAFLEWRYENQYEKPIYFYEEAISAAELETSAQSPQK